MAAPPQGSRLPRTDVAAFLRSVGAELRAADEFLCKTGAPPAPTHPAAATPLLLPQPEPVAPAAGMLTSGAGAGSTAAAAAHESEVAALMGLMVPQQLTQEYDQPAAPAAAATAPPQAAQQAPEEEQPAHAFMGRPAVLAPPTLFAAAPGIPHSPAPAAARPTAPTLPADQHTPAELRRSHAKVLSWLSSSGGERRQLLDDGPSDAIPAVHAAASQTPAAQRTGLPGDSWRQPVPQHAAAPMLRSPVQRLPPADYCAQLQRAGTPRKLLLARPACQGCGQAGPACCCPAAVGAAPLRLLRPRQAPHTSPGLRTDSGSGQQAQQHADPSSSMGCAAGPAPSLAPAGTAACISIQNAFFGDAGMLQGRAHIGGATGQPAAAPPLTHLPLPPPAAAAERGSSAGAAQPQLDVWAAYLAARRQAAAVTADGGQAGTGQGSGGGPLAELRGIAQRIRAMQGHISSFLLRQHGGPETAAGAAFQGALSGSGKQWGSNEAGPVPAVAAPVAPPAAAAQPAQRASAPPAQEPSSLFTDDFILSMQMGTDWRRLERAALEAAAGRSGAQGAGAAEGRAQDGRSSDDTAGASRALQRLKQAQRVVTAERVGRQRAP